VLRSDFSAIEEARFFAKALAEPIGAINYLELHFYRCAKMALRMFIKK